MIQQDNIRDFAVAAFRHYGHTRSGTRDPDSCAEVEAAASTIKHLRVEGETETVRLIERVYCSLPLGKLKRNAVAYRVNAAASEMNMDARTVWRKLAKARRLFYAYFRSVTESCHSQGK